MMAKEQKTPAGEAKNAANRSNRKINAKRNAEQILVEMPEYVYKHDTRVVCVVSSILSSHRSFTHTQTRMRCTHSSNVIMIICCVITSNCKIL